MKKIGKKPKGPKRPVKKLLRPPMPMNPMPTQMPMQPGSNSPTQDILTPGDSADQWNNMP